MTYEQAMKMAATITEKEMAPYFDDVLKTYDALNDTIETLLAKYFARMPDFTSEQKAAGEMFTWSIQRDRLKTLQAAIKAAQNESYKAIQKSMSTSFSIGITNTYYRQSYITSLVADLGQFVKLPGEIVKASVFGIPDSWREIGKANITKIFGDPRQYFPQAGSLSELLANGKLKELQQINNILLSGLKSGAGLNKMARQIADVIGVSNTKLKGAKAAAARIARTEGLRNISSGRLAGMNVALSQGIPVTKMWLATADGRTRDTHISADGQIREVNKNFNVNGATGPAPRELDQVGEVVNCRCDMIELIDGVQPELRRYRDEDGNTAVLGFQKLSDWMESNGEKLLK